MVRCGPRRSVTAPGKLSWVCCECVVEDDAFWGTTQCLSNEDPQERFCLGLSIRKGALPNVLFVFAVQFPRNFSIFPSTFSYWWLQMWSQFCGQSYNICIEIHEIHLCTNFSPRFIIYRSTPFFYLYLLSLIKKIFCMKFPNLLKSKENNTTSLRTSISIPQT